MTESLTILGAKASIYLKYKGEIEELGIKIAKGLLLPKFYYDTDQDPPHDIFGSCETLGFDITLKKMDLQREFSFILTIETEYSLKESFNDQMYDLSPWLARYVSKVCDLETLMFVSNNKGVTFKDGNTSDFF